jgi:hypothetical protein
MRREDLRAEERAILEDMLRQYVRQTNVCEETGLTEDEAVEAQFGLLEVGLIEILAAEDGSFAIVPTERGASAVARERAVRGRR